MNQLLRRIFQNGTNFVSVICNTHFVRTWKWDLICFWYDIFFVSLESKKKKIVHVMSYICTIYIHYIIVTKKW